MNKEYVFNSPTKGGKTKIIINNGTLTISRPGVMAKLAHGFTGEKTILIKNISAVQLKKAGFARGYIQFIIPGAPERKSGLINGSIDENIIYFDSMLNNTESNNNAQEIKTYIENYNLNSNDNYIVQNDKYDKLDKLQKLLDNGTINQLEFEEEKKKILNS